MHCTSSETKDTKSCQPHQPLWPFTVVVVIPKSTFHFWRSFLHTLRSLRCPWQWEGTPFIVDGGRERESPKARKPIVRAVVGDRGRNGDEEEYISAPSHARYVHARKMENVWNELWFTISIFYKSHRQKKTRVAINFYLKVTAPRWLLHFLKYWHSHIQNLPLQE